jgi:hypothetical protein
VEPRKEEEFIVISATLLPQSTDEIGGSVAGRDAYNIFSQTLCG